MANVSIHQKLRILPKKGLSVCLVAILGAVLMSGCSKDKSHGLGIDSLSSVFTPEPIPPIQTFPGPALNVRIQGQSNAVRMTPNGVAGLQNTLHRNLNVINCAVGGTYIREHMPGTAYFNSCEAQMPNPDIIVWYQGESDSKPDGDYQTWAVKFTVLLNEWQSLHGTIPIVYAQIATQTLTTSQPTVFNFWNWQAVKDQQAQISVPHTTMVKTDDLALEDGIHLTQESQYALGCRFAEAIQKL